MFTLPDVGLVINKLMGSGYVSQYSRNKFKLNYETNLGLSTTAVNQTHDIVCFQNPYNELLIWAVLKKRHKMAMFFCKRGEETLAKVIIFAYLWIGLEAWMYQLLFDENKGSCCMQAEQVIGKRSRTRSFGQWSVWWV